MRAESSKPQTMTRPRVEEKKINKRTAHNQIRKGRFIEIDDAERSFIGPGVHSSVTTQPSEKWHRHSYRLISLDRLRMVFAIGQVDNSLLCVSRWTKWSIVLLGRYFVPFGIRLVFNLILFFLSSFCFSLLLSRNTFQLVVSR